MSIMNQAGLVQGFALKPTVFYSYEIENSIWLDGVADNLYRTPSSTGDRQKFIYSFWCKRCDITDTWEVIFGADDGVSGLEYFGFQSTTDYYCHAFDNGADATVLTPNVYLDVSSWYHIFAIVDTTQATASDRIKLWMNGTEFSLTFSIDVTLNYSSSFNLSSVDFHIGRTAPTASNFFKGYLAEMHWLDGNTTATVDDFGLFKDGIWIPKRYTGGGYGTNGFYLDFSNAADLGADASGNNNDFTLESISSTNQTTDTPTYNYPIGSYNLSSEPSNLADGNLTLTVGVTAKWSTGEFQVSNVAFPDSGVWYLELFIDSIGTMFFGITDPKPSNYFNDCCIVYLLNGNMYESLANVPYASGSTTNDYIGLRADCDEGELEFYMDGTSQGIYSFDPSNKVVCLSDGASGNSCTGTLNFGQNPFQYSIPSGAQKLSFNNYPVNVIPSDAFVAHTRVGTGNVVSIDVGLAPDLVWIKNRDQADPNNLVDTVRGATNELNSDGVAGGTDVNGLTAFTSTGFTLGTGANGYNANNENHVDWCWKKGAEYGFDIVTYPGTGIAKTVNHSLGVAPSWMFVKCYNLSYAWAVYTDATGPTKASQLDTATAPTTSYQYWGNTAPTSTNFTVSISSTTNQTGQSYVAYLFAETTGYCKTGSYLGTGALATAPFVYCGFRPAFIIIKGLSTRSWMIMDTARSTYNLLRGYLYADLPNVEYITTQIAYTSTGFDIRSTWAQLNSSGIEYAYMAFAEYPLQHVNAR